MVFGNMGEDSGTGVAFTRDPATGENKFYGEFLVNAQGEDVVAGIRTPLDCETEMAKWSTKSCKELLEIKNMLEKHYRDMQDIEFTIERGKLYMLQTRTGKRNAAAAVKIAVRHGQGETDRREDGRPADRSGVAGSVAAPDVRSEGRRNVRRQGSAGLAGCGGRQARLHRR